METTKPKILLHLGCEDGCFAAFFASDTDDYSHLADAGLLFEGESCEECVTKMLQSGLFQMQAAESQWYWFLESLQREFPEESEEREKELSRPALLKATQLQYQEAVDKFLKRIPELLTAAIRGYEERIDEIKDSVAGSQIQNAFYQSLQEYAANRI